MISFPQQNLEEIRDFGRNSILRMIENTRFLRDSLLIPTKRKVINRFGGRAASQATFHPLVGKLKFSFLLKTGGKKTGRGDGRPNSKALDMNDPYGIDIAPLNIFENQLIPIGVHNIS